MHPKAFVITQMMALLSTDVDTSTFFYENLRIGLIIMMKAY